MLSRNADCAAKPSHRCRSHSARQWLGIHELSLVAGAFFPGMGTPLGLRMPRFCDGTPWRAWYKYLRTVEGVRHHVDTECKGS